MDNFLKQARFNFISENDKAFIRAFTAAIKNLGYDFGNEIGSGYCWGKYMIIYAKSGVRSRKVVARIYLRETGIVLRLFLNGIDQHREYLEHAPGHIKAVFTGDHANCNHCHNEKDGRCRFRKTYTLDCRLIEKCNGVTFEFHHPNLPKLPDYMRLLTEFYPGRKRRSLNGATTRPL